LSDMHRMLKQFFVSTLQSDLVAAFKLAALRNAGAVTVLNFHRVGEGGADYGALTPAVFDELVGWLKRYFLLILFRDLRDLANERRAEKMPLAIISFDDGYKNFLEVAAPILGKHGVAANQNVVLASIENGRPPINVELQDFIATAPASLLRETKLPGLPDGVDLRERAKSCFLLSRALKKLSIARQKEIYAELTPHLARYDGFRPTPMMNAEEIRQIAQTHEIGAHSCEHASMGLETDDYLREDARLCRSFLSERCGVETQVYAFPNGSFRAGQDEILREEGYSQVLCVGERFAAPASLRYPRFTIYGSSVKEARFRALGGLSFPTPREALATQK
jgi:peptidoglycan/xylan/chitin deacetylase (PgdA/CDA1 family)